MHIFRIKIPCSYLFLFIFISLFLCKSEVAAKDEPFSGEDESLISAVTFYDSTAGAGIGDSLDLSIIEKDTLKTEIENVTVRENILNLIQGAIFRDTTRIRPPQSMNVINREEDFHPYSGQRIANIYINKVPVFGGTVYDSLHRETSDVEKFGNFLHKNTRDRVIINNLMFDVGDTVKPFQLADNERILRSLPYIRDARIVVIPADSSDHVDIGIITRDVFSIGVNLNPRNTDDISFSIFDRNLFGNGWEFRNNFRYRSNLEPPLDYEGIFSIRNIIGTFISGSFVYKNNYDVNQIWFNLSKAYLTQEIKYGGGIDLIQTIQDDVNHDYKITLFKSQVQDYWVGRSFILGDPDDRRNIRIGARYFKLLYDKRPFTSADSNVTYHNRELYLGNITLSQLKYLTSSLITGFGITEDVPVGYSLEITGGLSDEEFKNRSYFGLEVRMASYNGNFGYLGGIAQLGSYLQNKEWEDGVFGLNFIYFSPLFNLGDYKFRQFFDANYTRGINRKGTNRIDIEDEDGIRGLTHEDLRGTERLVLKAQSVAFAPWALWGFRFAFFAFADAAWVGMVKNHFAQNDFFSGIGLGCRIRNEGLVFRTFNLRVAYYPKVPGGGNHFGFEFSTSEPLFFSQFNLGKPRVLPFE